MRKILAAAMLVALAAGGVWWSAARGGAPATDLPKWSAIDPPTPAPQLAFTDGDGRPVSLGDFGGRVVLLNLWATWCAPCVEEMPALDRLQAKLGGPDFAVVALSLDRGGRDKVEPFLRGLSLENLALYLDPRAASTAALAARGLPTTFLIDRQGRLVGKAEGAVPWDSPSAFRLIEHYMGRGEGGAGGAVRTSG
ncbi:TlpA family protein disulfide reductase [Arenibaculum pallidiluteum]|uniref:TlpA family protein disulfide reductase n=1 Tax=Arenibaculum pallidiluteum TaxID=2812559 RepID=UPI001F26CC3C|nr:TlpA disulfide reductase family protein [Arenibaculum pallidiluteum]